MKIAVSCKGTTPESTVDQHFGRSVHFLLYDTDSGIWEYRSKDRENSSLKAAVIKEARFVQQLGASIIISGHVGLKGCRELHKENIRYYTTPDQSALNAVEAFSRGELPEIPPFDLEEKWK